VVLAGSAYLMFAGRATGTQLIDAFRTDLTRLPHAEFNIAQAQTLGAHVYERLVAILGMFFAILVAVAIGACVAQVGFRILPDRLAPNFERISPAAGWQRLWSTQSAWRVVLAILKVAALVIVALMVIRERSGVIVALGQGSPFDAITAGWEVCVRVVVYLAGVLVILGVVDYVVHWRRQEAALRMTRQEMKDEIKREDGDPIIRSRIRQLQRDRAKQRMLVKVPKATVVITNPTHLAIAIRYERDMDRAPVVLAKGAGVNARQIAQLARRHSIPVLERPLVARAIYAAVKEGQEIPPELFRAVAEVIAFVFRLRGIAS
jgi:flagellar biosynthetic protein FlhB